MLERVRALPGEPLDAQEYLDDFWDHFRGHAGDFWKLERRQHFVEPGVPSWDAFAAGDWQQALALAEEMRPGMREHIANSRQLNRRRIRVVEHPVSPYLQWEMQVLRLRVLEGDTIRVLPASRLHAYETDDATGEPGTPLPELIVLGSSVLYEVDYDATGQHQGARRLHDRQVIAACQAELEWLYAAAQDLLDYFDRAIAPLPPPTMHA